jgi:hypothetical protein
VGNTVQTRTNNACIHVLSQAVQGNARITPRLGHERLTENSFQFIIQQLSCHQINLSLCLTT